jgi:hypothetical protein
MTDHTKPNNATRQADEQAAAAEHGAPQTPTAEEERAADSNAVEPDVAEHYEDMVERGARQKGEGRIGG